jgi:hypothetical protein
VVALVGLAGVTRRRGCKLGGSTTEVGMACRGAAWLGQCALLRRPAQLGEQRLGTGFIGQWWLAGQITRPGRLRAAALGELVGAQGQGRLGRAQAAGELAEAWEVSGCPAGANSPKSRRDGLASTMAGRPCGGVVEGLSMGRTKAMLQGKRLRRR